MCTAPLVSPDSFALCSSFVIKVTRCILLAVLQELYNAHDQSLCQLRKLTFNYTCTKRKIIRLVCRKSILTFTRHQDLRFICSLQQALQFHTGLDKLKLIDALGMVSDKDLGHFYNIEIVLRRRIKKLNKPGVAAAIINYQSFYFSGPRYESEFPCTTCMRRKCLQYTSLVN